MSRLLYILFFSSYLFSYVINVPQDAETIQEGIEEAETGDTVLVAPGVYYEHVLLEKEIVLASHAIYDDLETGWLNNENIEQTIISGAEEPEDPNKGSCLIIRDGNIAPTILGFTFQSGKGTVMKMIKCGKTIRDRSGGAILLFKAYPIIMYNHFVDNGAVAHLDDDPTATEVVTSGGGIGHFDDEDIEFDEDRNSYNRNTDPVRDVPATLNIQNNYFANNSSGNGENMYSHGYDGSIDVSGSVFENIDCETNTVNDFILHSIEYQADYIQNDITGNCIDDNAIYVSSSAGDDNNLGTETEPLKTIAQALGMVKGGDNTTIIHLSSGIYSRAGNGETFPIVIPDNVHLFGDETENTILDAEADEENEAVVMIIKEVENVVVANLTLTGGYSEFHGCTGGGGLLITANDMFNLYDGDGGTGVDVISTPTIENVIIEDNHSHNGGGLSFFRTHGPVLNNVIIRNNVATAFGGGVFSYGAKITMTDVTITGNENLEDGHGGGMMLAGTEGTFDNMTITNNTGCCHGGGVWTNHSGDNEPGWIMTNSTFSGNTAGMIGGGLALLSSYPTLINVTFTENSTSWMGGGIGGMNSGFHIMGSFVHGNSSGGSGGGIWAGWEGATPIIEDCIVSGNSTNSSGGGIAIMAHDGATISRVLVYDNYADGYIGGIDIEGNTLGSSVTNVTNVTVTGNSSGQGGGIGISANSLTNIANSIVWNNSGNEIMVLNAVANVIYSNVGNGYAGEGNINVDPLFYNSEMDDYTLAPGSPLIDAGTADIDGDGENDITDYNGYAPDMGAFEAPMYGPTGLNFEVDGPVVVLNWDQFTDPNLEYYVLQRSTDPLFVEDTDTLHTAGTMYEYSDLEWDTPYFYRVAAFVGMLTEYSDPVTAMIERGPGPTGFEYMVQDSIVSLWWDSSTDDDFEYYVLERSTDPQFSVDVDTTVLTNFTYEDTGLEWDTPYYYRVANFVGHLTEYSEILSVTVEWLSLSGNNPTPSIYALHQNYPNPFNPVTTLSYDLPEDAMVTITIYDMMGRMVKNLVSSSQGAGYRSVIWNAVDNQGQSVSAGLYIYTIQAGTFTSTKKMLLLK